MRINEIHIQSFGALRDFRVQLEDGINVLEGPNESGKTTLAAFIKYIFYGPGSKGTSDRTRYLTGSRSGGWLTLTTDAGKPYRIERITVIESDGAGGENTRDSVRIVDLQTSTALHETKPGEYFFGVGESVFVNTAYVGQMGAVRPDGTSLAGAVENMLHAGDENVNLKKAADKLNQARRELLPKNSAGGIIREKTEEKARLTEAYEASCARAAQTLHAESALAEASKKRQDMEAKKDQLEQIADAAGVVSACKKIAALEDTAKKLEGYQNALNVLDAPPYSDLEEKLASLASAETDEPMARTGTHLHMHNEEAAGALEEGEYLESKARLFLAVTITMVIAGLAALAAGAIMVYFGFPTAQFAIPFAAMAIFVVVGIVFYILQGRNLVKLDEILDEWSVDSLDELDELVETVPVPAAEVSASPADNAAAIEELARACGISTDAEPEALFAALQQKAKKAAADRETVRNKVENLKGRMDALEEQLEGVDRKAVILRYRQLAGTGIGKAAMQLDSEALAKVQKERDFVTAAWKAQTKKEAELEQILTAGAAPDPRTPDVLSTQLARLTEEITELEKRHAGYTLAYEALTQAGQSVRTGVIPTVTARASSIMRSATGGKYGEIAMDPSFGLRFTTADGSDSVEVLSKGTADLAYVSLRLALARTLFAESGREVPPMILDETFAAVDCARMERAMEAMASAEHQCLLFTCRADEGRIAGRLGHRVVSLGAL